MTDSNKQSLVSFLKGLLIFVLAMLTIITSAGIWNTYAQSNIDGFYFWCSIINFVAEGILIYFFAKKVLLVKKTE